MSRPDQIGQPEMVKLAQNEIKTKEVLNWRGLHLLHFSGSSCSQKTRIAMNLKGLGWISHPVNLVKQDNFKSWFLGINPRGLVPVLVDDGDVYIESNDILDYLDIAYPEVKLVPENLRDEIIEGLELEDALHVDIRNLTMRFVIPRTLAMKKPEALKTFSNADSKIKGIDDPDKARELKYWQDFAKYGITDQQVRSSVKRFRSVLNDFEKTLGNQNYLLGDRLTIIDIAWFIYCSRLSSAGYPIKQLHPNVFDWFTKLLARNEFAKEIKMDAPLKLISSVLRQYQKLKGKTLEKVARL